MAKVAIILEDIKEGLDFKLESDPKIPPARKAKEWTPAQLLAIDFIKGLERDFGPLTVNSVER
jgi:hypothetical protein